MPSPGRVGLSVGFRPGRIAFVTVMSLLLVPLSVLLGFMLGYLVSGLRSQAGYVAAGVLGGLALLFAVLTIVYAARRGAWLDDPVLVVRGLRTRSVDVRLARSFAVIGKGQAARRNRVLIVGGPDGQVKLPLRGEAPSLNGPAEMHLLADALSTSRCPGAGETVAWLRALAAHPHMPLR